MTRNADPFAHVPELKEKIVDPLDSIFRSMDIAALDKMVSAAGAPKDWRHSDTYREESRRLTLAGRMGEDIWVFAYGSLMWDPAFRFTEIRTAWLKGYQRCFCLKSVLGRGTPERPGMMAGLDIGGECKGLVFRIDRNLVEEETRVIWKREMLLPAYTPEFIEVDTPQGKVDALAFVIDHTTESYLPDLNVEETAHFMATGAGVLGSSLEYLENLARQFEILDIDDDALFKLRDRARQIATE